MSRVLLTDISSYKAIVIARFLTQHYPQVELHSCDTRPLTKLFRTRHAKNHTVLSKKHYGSALADLLRSKSIDILIPVNSEDIRLVMENRDQFGDTISYLGAANAFATLDQKDRLAALATTLGLQTPQRYSFASQASYPCVVKPIRESASRGVKYFDNRPDLEEYLRTQDEAKLIIQEFIQGSGCGYSGFARDGKILVGHAHQRMGEFPTSGGSSVWRRSVENFELREATEKLIVATSWSGFFMMEFKQRTDGSLCLIECNPRIWGSIHQGLANGANYFAPLFGDVPLPRGKFTDTQLSPLIYLSILSYALKGYRGKVLEWIKCYPTIKSDVNPLTDPRGYISMLLR